MRHVSTLFLSLTILLSLGILASPQSRALFGPPPTPFVTFQLNTFPTLLVIVGVIVSSVIIVGLVRYHWSTNHRICPNK